MLDEAARKEQDISMDAFLFVRRINVSNASLAFMIAVLEQQVRENYEEALTDSRVDKSKDVKDTGDF